jgi:hypothetical protein
MNEFFKNPIFNQLAKLPRGTWVEIEELITIIDSNDKHLKALIFEQVALMNLEHKGTHVRLSMKIPRLKP